MIIQYHACIVAQGNTQCLVIDFFKMYASVAQIKSVQILLSIAAPLDWEIYLININSAYLNSNLPNGKDIYLKQPTSYVIKGK